MSCLVMFSVRGSGDVQGEQTQAGKGRGRVPRRPLAPICPLVILRREPPQLCSSQTLEPSNLPGVASPAARGPAGALGCRPSRAFTPGLDR